MNKNFIIEGGDLVGKSTLLTLMEKELSRVETRHCIPVKDKEAQMRLMDKDVEYWWINQELDRASIFDRWYGISDIVYGDNCELLPTVVNMLSHAPVKVIILYASDDQILYDRFYHRGDEFVNIDQVIEANKKYKELIEDLEVNDVPVCAIDVAAYDTELSWVAKHIISGGKINESNSLV